LLERLVQAETIPAACCETAAGVASAVAAPRALLLLAGRHDRYAASFGFPLDDPGALARELLGPGSPVAGLLDTLIEPLALPATALPELDFKAPAIVPIPCWPRDGRNAGLLILDSPAAADWAADATARLQSCAAVLCRSLLVADLVATNELLEQQQAGALRGLIEDLEDRVREATLELEERNRHLEWQRQELRMAARLKSEFLASMSHELRTPLNVILGYISLLREHIYGELNVQQEMALAKLDATSQDLLELISGILDLSRIEAGRIALKVETLPLCELVVEAAQAMEPVARRKGLSIDTHVEAGITTIHSDGARLRQVLLNLLSNATKFTREGHIALTVKRLGSDRVRITVADTGIGIPAESLESIFDDFRQADQSRTREYGGAGLGLSISRKLVALLRGSIAVESTCGVGTRFHVDLPLTPVGDCPAREPISVRTTHQSANA